jgi:hypothetical protein
LSAAEKLLTSGKEEAATKRPRRGREEEAGTRSKAKGTHLFLLAAPKSHGCRRRRKKESEKKLRGRRRKKRGSANRRNARRSAPKR